MKHWLRWICIVMAFLCSACMATSPTGEATGALPKSSMPLLSEAKGRFVEQDITPQAVTDGKATPRALVMNEDGSLDLLLVQTVIGAPSSLVWSNDTWQNGTATATHDTTGKEITGASYYASLKDGQLSFYKEKGGEQTRQLALLRGDDNAAITADAEGTIYVATDEGIDRLPYGGSLFETILEGAYLFTSTTNEIVSLAKHPTSDLFYLLLHGKDGWSVCSYTFDTQAPTYSNDVLQVFSMTESDTIRRTMIEFQQAHPSVSVQYQIGSASPLSKDEMLKALKQSLESGRGPDVLILDGVPEEIYRGHLSELESPAVDYFKQVGDAGVQDGKRYVQPTRFWMPIVVGETAGLEADPEATDPANCKGVIGGRSDFEKLLGMSWQRNNYLYPGDSIMRNMSVRANGNLQPTLCAAINKSSALQTLGKEWIETMLSDYVQESNFSEGMPVCIKPFDTLVASVVEWNTSLRLETDMKALCKSMKVAD